MVEKYYASRLYIKNTSIWSSLDPTEDNIYSDAIFNSLLLKTLKKKQVKLNDYPGGKKWVSVFNTKVDDPLYDFNFVTSEFIYNKQQFVFFTTPHEFKFINSNMPLDFKFEVGVATTKSDHLLDLNLSSNFIFFEDRRLGLEEIHRGIVGGVLPYDEKVNSNMLNSIEQNRMRYTFGGQHILAAFPLHIKGGKQLYIPRIVPTIEQILADKTLVTAEDIIASINNKIEDIKKLNGVFTFSFYNSLFKDPIAKRAIIHFLKEKEKALTFFEVTEWERKKNEIEISIIDEEEDCFIKIRNNNKYPVENVVIQYDLNGEIFDLPIAKLGVDKEEVICVNKAHHL